MSEPIAVYELNREHVVTYILDNCTTHSVWGKGTRVCLYDDIKDHLIQPRSKRWWQFWKDGIPS